MTVYLDSVALLNSVINYLLLLLAGRVVDVPLRRVRLALGALLGGLYAVAVLFPALRWLGGFAGKAVAAALMVLIAFGGPPWRKTLRVGLIFLAASVTLGGAMLLLGLTYIPLDAPTLLIGAGVSYAALTLLFRRRARHGLSERTAVEIVWQNRICRFTALRDSGHTLTDPFTGAPVVVADWDAAAPALPANVRGLLSRALLNDPVRAHETLIALTPRLRLLPYRAVGTESGFLLAFRPDSLRLDGKKLDRGLVALSPTPVSDGQDVSALISV